MRGLVARNLPLLLIGGSLGALLVLATACGGDDDDAATGEVSGATTAAATEEATDDTEDGEDETASPTDDAGDGDDSDSEVGDNGFLGEDVDTCTLLTTDEINDITGFDVQDGVDATTDPFWSCDWAEEVGSTVSVSVYTGSSQDDLDLVYSTGGGEPVEGVGKEAQWRTTFLPVLEVMTDKYVLGIYVTTSELDDDEIKQTSIDLAEVAVGRLP